MSEPFSVNPLRALGLPGLDAVDCAGLILIVGPNSSGKSQLLRDIHERVVGLPRRPVVASHVGVRTLAHEPLMKWLVDEGLIRKLGGSPNGPARVQPLTSGTGQYAGEIEESRLEGFHQNHGARGSGSEVGRDEYLAWVGPLLVTALFLERRLTSQSETGVTDFVNQPPQHDLHALHLNDDAKADLLVEVRGAFSKAVWPDTSRGSTICLKVSDTPDVPTPEDRLSPRKMAAYRTIGD